MKYMSVGFSEIDVVQWPMLMRNNFSNLRRMGHTINCVECSLETAEAWKGSHLPDYLRTEVKATLNAFDVLPFMTWDGVEFYVNEDAIGRNTFVVFLK